jgi:iron uptake system EfeUOB component EfeO/EfeM
MLGAFGGAAIVGGLGFGGLVYVTRSASRSSERAELTVAVSAYLALVDELANRFERTTGQRVFYGAGRNVNELLREIHTARARLELIEPIRLREARRDLGNAIDAWADDAGNDALKRQYTVARGAFHYAARAAIARPIARSD